MKFRFDLRALAILASFVIASCSGSATPSVAPPAPPPQLPSIKHVIVMVQENRSFNNLFVGFPGAKTAASGPCAAQPAPPNGSGVCRPNGTTVTLKPITLETTGTIGGRDICHDHKTFEIEYDGGKMDGFGGITAGTNCQNGFANLYPYAYVKRSEVAPYWQMAHEYTLGDQMFSTATTDSFVAHQQIIAGTTRLNASESLTDTPSSAPWGCDNPIASTTTGVINTAGVVNDIGGPFPCFTQYKTMADVLDAANVPWKFYVANIADSGEFSGQVWNGFDAIKHVRHGADWKNISTPNTNVLSDIKNGSLPSVSWLIPTLACSDHPASGSNLGPSWVASVVDAVGKSKYWQDTAIVIIWDDWGGFYDPVPPAQIDYTSLGMRVPVIVISQWAKHGYVSHTQYDFGSILKYEEQNFGAGSLGASDATANSLGDVFNFSQPANPFREIPVQQSTTPCQAASGTSVQDFSRKYGIPD